MVWTVTFSSCLGHEPLSHWGRDKMATILQTTLSNAFSWMKLYEFRLKFHQTLFLRVQLIILQHWFRYWLGADEATSHYLDQCWLDYLRIYASLGLNELYIATSYVSFVSFYPLSNSYPKTKKLYAYRELYRYKSGQTPPLGRTQYIRLWS